MRSQTSRCVLCTAARTFHRTSGMSSTGCAMASSYMLRARSSSPSERSSSANLHHAPQCAGAHSRNLAYSVRARSTAPSCSSSSMYVLLNGRGEPDQATPLAHVDAGCMKPPVPQYQRLSMWPCTHSGQWASRCKQRLPWCPALHMSQEQLLGSPCLGGKLTVGTTKQHCRPFPFTAVSSF